MPLRHKDKSALAGAFIFSARERSLGHYMTGIGVAFSSRLWRGENMLHLFKSSHVSDAGHSLGTQT